MPLFCCFGTRFAIKDKSPPQQQTMARDDYVPLGEKAPLKQKQRQPWLQRIALALTGVLAVSTVYHHVQQPGLEELLAASTAIEPLPVRPSSYVQDASKLKYFLHDPEFRGKAAGLLSGAIQIETESYDDNPDPADDMAPWDKFYGFHGYLKRQFPLVHEAMEVETVNNVNLVYTWKGSDESLKPLLLTAHQDVVPVDPLSVGEWSHGPYSGHFDGTTIWGRGSQDCKNLLIAEMTAAEELLKVGFQPKRTVLFAFGHDEESGGLGAGHINNTLTARYGENSFYAIVDEGSSIANVGDEWFALPAVSEKGHLDVIVALTMVGGHSSMPPDHTAIGVMSEFIAQLESNPFEPHLPNDSPVLRMLESFATYIEDWPKELRKDVLAATTSPAAKKRVLEWVSKASPELKYLAQTSQAVDIINGGVKSNALPEYVKMLVNYRIALESNLDETLDHFFDILDPIAKKYGLPVYFDGEQGYVADGAVSTLDNLVKSGYINVTLAGPINSLPVTASEGPVWDILTGTLKHVFEDEILPDGKKLHCAPGIMTGNTDTKRYTGLTENIFRFQATRMIDINSGLHSINEHIGIDQHIETMVFLYEFIQNVDEATD